MKAIAIILSILSLPIYSYTHKITVINKTEKTIQVTMVPQGVMGLSRYKRTQALRKRFVELKPGYRAKLNADKLESMDVKVLSHSRRSMSWNTYDKNHAQLLLAELTKNKDQKIKLAFSGEGDRYYAKIGDAVVEGKISQISKIFR